MGPILSCSLGAQGAPVGQHKRQRKAGSLCTKAQTASLLLSAEQRYIKPRRSGRSLCKRTFKNSLFLSGMPSPLRVSASQKARFPADLNQPALFILGQLVVRQVQLLAKYHNPFLKIAALCPGKFIKILFEGDSRIICGSDKEKLAVCAQKHRLPAFCCLRNKGI